MTIIDGIGFLGVSLILLAYFLQLNGKLHVDAMPYILFNLIGACLACFASWWISYYPFVLLEGTWVVVSFSALLKKRA